MDQHRVTSAALALIWVCSMPVALTGQAMCTDGERPRADLGIWIDCDCTVNADPSRERPWTFRSPIRVWRVAPGAQALQEGDLILAANGHDVTSPRGATEFAGLRPGQAAVLMIQRDGRTLTIPVTPKSICGDDPRAIGNYVPGPPAETAPERPANQAPEGPGAPVADGQLVGPGGMPQLRVHLGFALACRDCGWAIEAGDSLPYWESAAPPSVYAVQPGTPAARAGLRQGDVLTRVNGHPVTSAAGGRAFGALRPGRKVRLSVRRGAEEFDIEIIPNGSLSGVTGVPSLRYEAELGGVGVEVWSPVLPEIQIGPTGTITIHLGESIVRLVVTETPGTPGSKRSPAAGGE